MRPGTSAIVGGRPSSIPEVHDPEVGLERRERVVGDLGLGGREGGEQRRLAGVREPDEADIGDETELQAEPALLARLALLGVLRRLVGGRREVLVAEPAASTARDDRLLAGGDEVAQRGLPISSSKMAVPGGTSRTRSSPALPWRRERSPRPPEVALKWWLVLEVAERGLARIDPQVDGPAPAAIAAVGTAARNVGLLPEGRRTVAARAGTNPDLYAVEEHAGPSSHGPPGPEAACAATQSASRGPPAHAGERAVRMPTVVAERVDPVEPPFQTAPVQTSKWRCGPVAQTGLADPADLRCPSTDVLARSTVTADMWLYVVYRPEPWEIQTW